MFTTIHRVANVDEAVELAEKSRRQGTYDWFRGQIKDLPVASSYSRLSAEEQPSALEKVTRFYDWCQKTPGLEKLSSRIDMVLAVAQHYGLPTNLIDFTTEPKVAGFFASYGKAEKGDNSCIICLDTVDLREFFECLPSEYRPKFLGLEVPDLWRLETQHGKFLFTQIGNFETIYKFDRIVFPFTASVEDPTKVEAIIPKRKSNLEILLDQYFMGERQIEEYKILTSYPVTLIPFQSRDYVPEVIGSKGLPVHLSWDLRTLLIWLTPEHERYSKIKKNIDWVFECDFGKDPSEAGRAVSDKIRAYLKRDQDARKALFSFSLGDSSSDRNIIAERLAKIWDGIRGLPYTDDDVAESMGNCVALYLHKKHLSEAADRWEPTSWLAATSRCFGDAMEVEMGANDNSYSRAYVAKNALRKVVRNDIAEFLHPDHRKRLLSNVGVIMSAIMVPSLLFDFGLLVKLFAQQIIPTQVLTRGNLAIYYSPARLKRFGLP